MTMREELNRAAPIVDRLNDAIRENPLAAGLIGAGVAWMLFGGPKGFGAVAGAVAKTAGPAGAAVSTAGGTVASSLSRAGSGAVQAAKHTASQAAETAASIVPEIPVPDTDGIQETASNVRSAVGEGVGAAATSARQYGTVFQSKLSESLERQPLLLGALGLAIGAGIASTFASTSTEGQWMGGQAATARDRLQTLADDVKDRATQVIAGVKDEAARQGLTAGGLKDAAAGIGEKVKAVAGAGQDSVAQHFSGS